MVAYAFSTKQVDLQDLPGPMNFWILAYWKKNDNDFYFGCIICI